LVDGDRLQLLGIALAVTVAIPRPDLEARAGFVLARADGASFGIVHTPFVVGGGDTDDLIVKKWPARVLSLHVAQSALFVELHTGAATRTGQPLEADALTALAPGDRLACRGESFVVRGVGGPEDTTALRGADLPSRVVIEMLPCGGRVVFTIGAGE